MTIKFPILIGIVGLILLTSCNRTKRIPQETIPSSTRLEKFDRPTYSFMAIDDFSIVQNSNPFYPELKTDALAVDPSISTVEFASAELIFEGESGIYQFITTTMPEIDGQSSYRLVINGEEINEVINPLYTELAFINLELGQSQLNTGDTITIRSNCHTNKQYFNKGKPSYARGRWTRLMLTPQVEEE